MDYELIAREIVDTAIRVHTRLGPGMLESAYEACTFTRCTCATASSA
jgi:hypothetical protein